MSSSIDKIVCISKELFNHLRLIVMDTSDVYLDENKDSYLVEYKLLNGLIKKLDVLLKNKERDVLTNTKGMDLSRYDQLKDELEKMKYEMIRDKHNLIKTQSKFNEEKQLELKVKMYDELIKLQQIPLLILQINDELKEIKSSELSDNFNSYMIRYKSLVINGAYFEDYDSLKKELDLIIKKTYIDNISCDVSDGKNIFIVKENSRVSILSSDNVNNFHYGFIYSSNSICNVSNNQNKSFITFSDAVYSNCEITINEDKPIAVYAVTLGEKSINPNYQKAMSLHQNDAIPLVEIDKTKFLNSSDVDIKELIDNLLEDKGLKITNKDSSFYGLFKNFYNKFDLLKTKEYDESRIINLFDFSFNMIFSQRYIENINNVLDERLGIENIKDILENNIYFDFNIFRNDKTNKSKIDKFFTVFYPVKDNGLLNNVYPGINSILDMLSKATEEKTKEIIDIINHAPCRDSWLISQLIKPSHTRTNTKQPSRLSVISEEKAKLNTLMSILKSKDDYSR